MDIPPVTSETLLIYSSNVYKSEERKSRRREYGCRRVFDVRKNGGWRLGGDGGFVRSHRE